MNTRNLRFKSNRVRDILALFHEELDGTYGTGEVGIFCEMFFEAFVGWDKVRLLTSKEQPINQSDLLRFHWALEDLKRQRPIQHIIGYTDFCGCRISVTPDVLIPRPETEEIVQWLISHFTSYLSSLPILDLCTGSGCIAIALKKAFPSAEVTAIDISPAALDVARKNAEDNGVSIRFLQADILDERQHLTPRTFQLIVSNPPYVRHSERAAMAANVLDYEPSLALFVPDEDPLLFYRAIARFARQHLAPTGLVALEINEALASDTCSLLRQQGFLPKVYTDFRGKERFISARTGSSVAR